MSVPAAAPKRSLLGVFARISVAIIISTAIFALVPYLLRQTTRRVLNEPLLSHSLLIPLKPLQKPLQDDQTPPQAPEPPEMELKPSLEKLDPNPPQIELPQAVLSDLDVPPMVIPPVAIPPTETMRPMPVATPK